LNRSALVVAGFLVALLVTEGGLRLTLGRYLNPFEPDDVVGYRLKTGFDGFYPWTPVHTDEHGFRVGSRHRPSKKPAILFVGDSVTFGFGVLADDAYPQRFGERIGRPDDVLNAAVPGYNLEQVLVTIRRFLEVETPELIVYGLCLNDIGAARLHGSYASIDPHQRRVLAGGFLPSSLMVSVVERRLDRLMAGFHTAPTNTKDGLLRDFSAGRLQGSIRAFDRQWAELEDLQHQSGIPIVVLILPYRQQIVAHPDWRAPQEYLALKCSGSSLRCLDPWALFEAHRQEGLYSGSSSMHLSPDGHRVIAEWLAENLYGGLRIASGEAATPHPLRASP
jgi:lysophospholipase L1-like esterase